MEQTSLDQEAWTKLQNPRPQQSRALKELGCFVNRHHSLFSAGQFPSSGLDSQLGWCRGKKNSSQAKTAMAENRSVTRDPSPATPAPGKKKETATASAIVLHLVAGNCTGQDLSCANTFCLNKRGKSTRSSSRKVRIRAPTFSVVCFSRGTLPQTKGKRAPLRHLDQY